MTDSPGLQSLVISELVHGLDAAMEKIKHCLGQLSEEQVWWRPGGGQNSVGNLLLHLTGNLTQWVVGGLGGAAIDRDRAAEFDPDSKIEKQAAWDRLNSAVRAAVEVLQSATEEQLTTQRVVQGFTVTGVGAAFHAVLHFAGHAQQIIQLTRLQLGEEYEFHWRDDQDRGPVPL